MNNKVVIAGAGHAAGQLIATLKQKHYNGQIVLVGDEDHLPYQRPPLSKKFLSGELAAERLYVKPEAFFDDPQIELRLATSIVAIDRFDKRVETSHGDMIDYDNLVLALGSRVRRLTVSGAELAGIHYLRTIADVDGIRTDLLNGKKAVIIGAGYIGLEVAAVLRQLDLDVTVVEMADRVMSRVVSPETSDFYQIEHASHGVKLRLGTGLKGFIGTDRVEAIETTDGDRIDADFVVVGVGIQPNTEIAEAAGLAVDNGITVNDQCQTDDPHIYAIGDCTSHPSTVYGRSLRLESVQNALEQAKTAATNLTGEESHYSEVPWFWSDQYDLKLQIAGLSAGYDDIVIRGNPAARSFACMYLKDQRLIATDAVNSPKDFVQSKAIIAAGMPVDRERIADSTIALKDL